MGKDLFAKIHTAQWNCFLLGCDLLGKGDISDSRFISQIANSGYNKVNHKIGTEIGRKFRGRRYKSQMCIRNDLIFIHVFISQIWIAYNVPDKGARWDIQWQDKSVSYTV